MTPGLIIAGTHSGCGKSTVTLGLLAALTRAGVRVAPFKVGPDYIDPGLHRHITSCESVNLDGWMLDKSWNARAYARHSDGYDLALIEGVMGLFDGFSGTDEAGSTAQMAKWLGIPVILVISAASMARSAAAMVTGFDAFDPELKICGVIFNQVGSTRHAALLTDALQSVSDIPCIGCIPKNPDTILPKRHLGLVTADEGGLSDSRISALASLISDALDLDLLTALARFPESMVNVTHTQFSRAKPPGVRIGIARDAAFSFYYAENIRLLEAAGADPVFFSPISDTRLPQHIGGLYLGGGYPEQFASALSANHRMRDAIAAASASGMPVYGECGGLIYLSRVLTGFNGTRYDMCGCLPLTVSMQHQRAALGYREVVLAKRSVLGPAGTRIRGHEFHYSVVDEPVRGAAIDSVYTLSSRTGRQHPETGYMKHNTIGSYVHLHFGSCPAVAQAFTDACAAFDNTHGDLA
ncbi:MAG: cobyrinic acid a,c-diamide synthase [Deltaproteobacteria bacterium]|nr:MAG: cobyrinic acid a,c-diamide synthase [Deltaproteobacteria bacterium]